VARAAAGAAVARAAAGAAVASAAVSRSTHRDISSMSEINALFGFR
jgi:hypothetical protein